MCGSVVIRCRRSSTFVACPPGYSTGCGSLLPGFDTVLTQETGLPVIRADDPLNCVARGAGRALEDLEYRGVLYPV